MSFLLVQPEMVSAATESLTAIRSALGEVSAAVAGPTTAVVAAAGDEVSAAISQVFGAYGQEFQALNAQAAAFQAEFEGLLSGGAAAYVSAEALNSSVFGPPMQELLKVVNAPTQMLLGRSLIADGANATVAGGDGRPGGILMGKGGDGAPGGPGQPGGNGGAAGLIGTGGAGGKGAPSMPGGLGGRGGLLWGDGGKGGDGGAPVYDAWGYLLAEAGTGGAGGLPGMFGGLPGVAGAWGGEVPTALAAPMALSAAASSPAAVGGAYQTLFDNTWTNLQAIGATWNADPAPFLSQFIANQQTYANTVFTSLSNSVQDFGAGLVALPAAYQGAFQALMTGNVSGAVEILGKGYLGLVFNGFDYTNVPVVTVQGALGDLLPMTTIPGQISQNMTNVLQTVTDTSIMANISLLSPSFTTGFPLTLALDALGAPIVTGQAALQSATTFIDAVQAGDVAGAFGAIVDAPAVIANGFLNGEGTITLDLPTYLSPISGTESLTSAIPIGGILTPLQPVDSTIVFRVLPHTPPVTQHITLGGTEFGGLIPGLQSASAQLADAIKLS
ncbi:PE family protein [Mycobacterium marinum]|uniref:PE family protein n=1 Tax=Mycobacterium marinum TaxID=1781 RepID=UPI00045FCF43|nr:PE family protein [Mycobacterium marinum]AXN44396.1 PE family protein [Mycobacterium marinum]RFZ09946.1 PE family protein [Mycobacterium marinum]RFZ12902.1 PE family protein [Mycobacterium marinum]RFZ49240.1 PE family protein [Mycobacterium marinum]CDM76529.1 PE-PGRS family protein [Mycobacterium marinum E11]